MALDLSITNGILGVRPPVTKPHPGFLQQAGEDGVRKLASDHYDLIKDSEIAFLFPVNDDDDFAAAQKHAADFLIQICGGRDLFTQSRGAPRMVGRHAPFRIDNDSRVKWLELYATLMQPLVDSGIDEEYVQSVWNYLDIFSIWMINTPD